MKRWELEVAYGKLQRENAELRAQLVDQSLLIGDLRQVIEDQAAVITALRAEVAALKEQIEDLRRSGHRQAARFRRDADQLSSDPKRPGRKAGQGKWSRGAEPTAEQKSKAVVKTSHLDACPCCGGELEELAEHEHTEWDIPPVEPVLTIFTSESGYCPACGQRFHSRHPDQISQASGAAGVVIGPHAKALASDMKHHLGLSYAKVSAFFAVAFGLSFGRSGLFRADLRLAARASPVYAELIELVRQLVQVHVDETSWRIGTMSAWLWVFCGQGVTVYRIAKSRGHEVVLEILGQEFKGYLTSDGLLTYDAAALASWLKQKCLAHILRNLKELSAGKVAAHMALAEAATAVLKDAIALCRRRAELDAGSYAEAAAAIEQRLDEVIAAHFSSADDDGARMARHLTKHRQHLLSFLYVEGLEPTNNDAERGLRPGVITRKVGACNRTDEGAHAHAVLASIGATCRRRGIPVIDFLMQVQRASDSLPSLAATSPTVA
jgi:transposase